MSSPDVVSTERDGGSQLWPVKGTLVSTVMVLSSVGEEANWRRRDEVVVEVVAADRGLRRLELR